MGAQQRVLRQRIKDTQATKKITKAMELIASSQIMKAQAAVEATEPYAQTLQRALTLATSHAQVTHPLLTVNENPKRAAVLVVTSDRGLAGAYSSNVIKEAEKLGSNLHEKGVQEVNYLVGRKSIGYYSFRERPIEADWSGFSDKPSVEQAENIANRLLDDFLKPTEEGGVDEIHIVFTRFVSRVTQIPTVLRIVPLDIVEEVVDTSGSGITAAEEKGGKAIWPLYDFEPGADETLDALLPQYITHLVYVALLEAAASEHAARQRAMKSASDNAEDLIKSYTRQANQARQAEITQEISEIVGGADALASAK